MVGGGHHHDRGGLRGAPGRRVDPLLEALGIDGDQAPRSSDNRGRASIVGGELHPSCGRVELGEPEDAPHVGQAPGVDRLVVIAHHEQVLLGLGQDPDEPQLGGVDVLELVDRQVAEARLPAATKGGISAEQVDRTHDQVVEVECAAGGQQVVEEGKRRDGFRGWCSPLDLPGGEERVQRGSIRDRNLVRRAAGEHASPSGAQQWQPVGQQVDRVAGVEEDLARESMQRAHLHAAGCGQERTEAGGDACAQLAGRLAIEGDHRDPVGRHATGQQHPEPGDERGRLAAAGRRDDLRRPIGQGRGGPLFRVE